MKTNEEIENDLREESRKQSEFMRQSGFGSVTDDDEEESS